MLYVTYCSRDKNPAPGKIPAIERYLSPRILEVHDAATEVGAAYRILSGEFGLLAATDPIPDYDHLLTNDEVDILTRLVARQLAAASITGVRFFSRSPVDDPDAVPYRAVMEKACRRAGLALTTVEYPIGP